ncbi:MAG: competence protein ComK [Erysipelotrichaceae bacterium]
MIIKITYCSAENYCEIEDVFSENRIVRKSFRIIVNGWCNSLGGSIDGNVESIKKLLSIRKNVPIFIRLEDKFIIFPVGKKNIHARVWINYGAIKIVRKIRSGVCEIVFFNDEIIIVENDIRTIRTQMSRCKTQLEYIRVQRQYLEID